MLLGGDHTVAWPAMAALLDADPARNSDVGVIHFDAHTDLLPERLGVRYCFATWAWHANQRLGGGERMLQIGVRVSQRDRGAWERTQEVRQVWAEETAEMTGADLGALAVAHLRRIGANRVYISNDLDGTDPAVIPAVGTPEPGDFVRTRCSA